jgi:hypothetical protein
MILASFFLAGSVVTLMHYWRVRRWRALPLAAMFALLGLARTQPYDSRGQFWSDLGAGAAGLVHLALLVPRHAPEPGSEERHARA